MQRPTPLGGWVLSAMPLAKLVAHALPVTTHWSPDVFKEELRQLDEAKIEAVCSFVSEGLRRLLNQSVTLLRKVFAMQHQESQVSIRTPSWRNCERR